MVGVGSPPPVPLACPARGGSRSGLIVLSVSRPSPGIPPSDKLCRFLSVGRISGRSWDHLWGRGGGGPDRPGPPYSGPTYCMPRTLPPVPCCTWGRVPVVGSPTSRCDPTLSLLGRRPPQSDPQARGKLTRYDHRLGHISVDSHAVKESRQGC